MDHRTAMVLASAAEAIHASREIHRIAQESHRRQVKRLSNALDEVLAEAKRLGCPIEITQTKRRSQ
jgi:hypothetical protein